MSQLNVDRAPVDLRTYGYVAFTASAIETVTDACWSLIETRRRVGQVTQASVQAVLVAHCGRDQNTLQHTAVQITTHSGTDHNTLRYRYRLQVTLLRFVHASGHCVTYCVGRK